MRGPLRLLRRQSVVFVLLTAAAGGGVAEAAKSPFKASIDCRGTIADAAKSALGKALTALDACHRARDKGDRTDDCNVLPFEAGKLATKVADKCLAGDPVLVNYADGDPTSRVTSALQDLVHESGSALASSPPLTGDKVAAKCRDAIDKGRTKIVKGIVTRSVRCQKALDKTASQFGPLDALCILGSDDKTDAAVTKAIAKACRRKIASKTFEPIAGATVGSCDPLPSCVVTAATATGKTAAASLYKAPLDCADQARAGNPRSFLARVFVATHSGTPRFGSYRKMPKPPAGAGAAPGVSLRSRSIVGGGGRQFKVLTKSPAGGQSIARGRAVATDRLWVVAGPEGATCLDVYTIPLASLGSDHGEDIDFEAEFVDDLAVADLPLRFALGNADGPLTAYETATVKPTGGFLRRVRDIRTGPAGSDPRGLTDVGGTLFFTAAATAGTTRVWKTDSTDAGTVPLSPEELDVNLRDLTAVGSQLAYTRCLGASCDLMQTDGTTPAPTLVAEDVSTACAEDATAPVAVGSRLYFSSDSRSGTSANGCEPWRSDGPATTVPIVDVRSGLPGSNPHRLTPFSTTVVFFANSGANGLQVWQTDGIAGHTTALTTFPPGADLRELTVAGGNFFYTRGQTELWKGPLAQIGTFDRVSGLTKVGNTLFFVGCDASLGGCELWQAPSGAPPIRVRDINPTGDSDPEELVDVGGTLFFSAIDGQTGRELWRSNGTEASTIRVRDIVPGSGGSDPESLTSVGGLLVFVASDGSRGREVWQSDGTEDGTDRVRDFAVGLEDAKLAGDRDEPRIVAADSVAYFTLDDGGQTGAELYALKPFLGTPAPLATPTPAGSPTATPIATVTPVVGSCCAARPFEEPAPGCEVAACAACVCAFDPFCCTTSWDPVCAAKAAKNCLDPCPCAPPATPTPAPTATPQPASCCVPHDTPECEVRACSDCICDLDTFCCGSTWDQACAAKASGGLSACSDACQICSAQVPPTPTPTATPTPGPQSCCAPHAEIGCDDQVCSACVCSLDSFCCSSGWDSVCASEASGTFPACNNACAVCAVAATPTPAPTPISSVTPTPEPTATPIDESCCAAHPTVGCDVQACQDCVCGMDSFCCTQNWDQSCVEEASGLFSTCAANCACGP